ncbi:hypothetical protein E1B28_013768 [Marasmius oreades]|uniref:Uncharacterized protein n=1 Tax=Marasmius oreades TaxID=181124 RepID=A0A9P7UQ78_9AGAR|nr:uncharacterized protein E1B28_013768 [Marasmius oreades]KAG7087829.1 hypothetical protein E1B28_013768 [Marasmius oreades]
MLFTRAFFSLLVISFQAVMETTAAPSPGGGVIGSLLRDGRQRGQKCSNRDKCCEGLVCRNEKCEELTPQCVAVGEKCGRDRGDCCKGLKCDKGLCKAKAPQCLASNVPCDLTNPGACCSQTCIAATGCL